MYTVQVTRHPDLSKWLYPVGYFPRQFNYLSEAQECARLAITAGATAVKIEYPDGSTTPVVYKPTKAPLKKPAMKTMPRKVTLEDRAWLRYSRMMQCFSPVERLAVKRMLHRFTE